MLPLTVTTTKQRNGCLAMEYILIDLCATRSLSMRRGDFDHLLWKFNRPIQ